MAGHRLACPGRETGDGPRTWRLLFCKQHHQTRFHYGKYRGLIQVSRIFIPKRTIYNKHALDQIMAWRREADKRLSEAVTVLYTDACMRHLSQWVFEGIIIFCTISCMFCVYVFWRHDDPFNVCNRPCFDLFWYHWLFCIGLWWPCCLFRFCQVTPVSTEPRCWRSYPPEWSVSKAQTKPGMDQSMAMSINCNPMIELYIR